MYQHLEGLYNEKLDFTNNKCYAWVKGPHKVQERLMKFKVTEYKRLINVVSESPLQLTFKKQQLVFPCSIKEQYPRIYEKVMKILFSCPVTCLFEAKFSSYVSTKATYCVKLNAEVL